MSNRTRSIDGFLPSYLMLELVHRNPGQLWHSQNIVTTQRLWQKSQSGQIWVPAATGKALIRVYDAKNSYRIPGSKARFEPEGPVSDAVLNKIYEYSVAVRKFHKDVLGINSMDDLGMDYINTGHYGQKYNNAYNNGTQMVFGDGDGDIFVTFVLLDVVAHEDGHEITGKTCALEYQDQAGALNEHLSDVDGVVCRQYTLKLSADQDTWLIGPGIFSDKVNGRALRDMLNPGTAYDDKRLGKDPQPDHMSKYVQTSQDNGGVHFNSGIPNKAFAVFAKAVGGNSWESSYLVWKQIRHEIQSDCDFQTFADKSVDICKRVLPKEVQKLKDAWAAVGIKVA
ncbi:MAG TPA: M4 family metallopeptidase [Planktothrix sp.]|jgi:Zn-dependent metalloprotease